MVIKASWFHLATHDAIRTAWAVSGAQLIVMRISTRLTWRIWRLSRIWSVDGTTCPSHSAMVSDENFSVGVKCLNWKWQGRVRLKSNSHRTRAPHSAVSSSTMSDFPMLATIVATKHFLYGRACLPVRNFRPIIRPWCTVSIRWRRKKLMKFQFWSIRWICRKGIEIF